ncbi:MAG: hypothetical protein ACI4LI_02300, partial [Candidatus Fimenecus sp.]
CIAKNLRVVEDADPYARNIFFRVVAGFHARIKSHQNPRAGVETRPYKRARNARPYAHIVFYA